MSPDVERLEQENEHLRAEVERLRAAARRSDDSADLEAIFPAFPAYLLLLAPDGTLVGVRAGGALHFPLDASLGKRLGEVLPPEPARVLEEAMARARSGSLVVAEYSQPLLGAERHIEARLLRLGDGRVAALCLDVTERRVAEAAARRQAEQLAHLTARSPSVLYSLALGPAGPTVSSVSANLERLLGYTAAEVAPPGWWSERVHPEDRERAVAAAATVIAQGQVAHTYRFRHRDGSWRWIHDELRLSRDAEGRPGEVVGSLSDVTAQREAEEALRQSDERYRAILERTTDALLIVDVDARITWASPASRQVYGVDPADLIGTSSLALVHPDDLRRLGDTTEGVRARRAAPGVLRLDEVRVRHRDGTWRLVQVETRNLLHVPAVQGVVVTVRDITEQRRLEEQYFQSQKLESVGRLAGGIAHDFNNLLIGILGYVDFLEEGIRSGNPSLDDLAEIRLAGERARDLTRQLLAVARKQLVQPTVLDVNGVLRDTERLLQRVLGEDVELAVTLASDLWAIRADPTQLHQVLLNLAVNARDAMPRGGKLTVETSNVELDERLAAPHDGVRPGPYVLLAVSDTGEGMSAETQAHAFEPFFTTKPAGMGTGLGLATVYGIVRQAGGHICLSSEPGRGTTFKIYLPRTGNQVEPAARRPAAAAPGGTETVLVVEDEAQVRGLTVRALRAAGYRVLQAAGGAEALELAARTPETIDLLLTDVVMPGLSGQQLAEALGAIRPAMRVLYVSGYTRSSIAHRGALDPGVQFLAKPFTPAALQEKVRKVLDDT